MSVVERLPTSRRGHWLRMAGAGAVCALAYWVNNRFWDRFLYDGLGMDPEARLTETIHLVYDTVKIVLMLVGISFIVTVLRSCVTVLRSYMSIERTRALLGGRREGVGSVMAAGLGVIGQAATTSVPTQPRSPRR